MDSVKEMHRKSLLKTEDKVKIFSDGKEIGTGVVKEVFDIYFGNVPVVVELPDGTRRTYSPRDLEFIPITFDWRKEWSTKQS